MYHIMQTSRKGDLRLEGMKRNVLRWWNSSENPSDRKLAEVHQEGHERGHAAEEHLLNVMIPACQDRDIEHDDLSSLSAP
jgi:hypothetical protein